MGAYFDELCRAMEMIAQTADHPIFLGQAVACEGTGMSKSFAGVDRSLLLEMPVTEDMQMGMAIGLSLAGCTPVSIYPRFNFLLLATNQLVLHLDKLPLYSGYRPKVIIRTAIATKDPLDPGPQHLGDFTEALKCMLSNVLLVRLWCASQIVPAYQHALDRPQSTIIIEQTELY